jgi:predicted Zn finger-like uncharacterized protein
MSTPTPLTVVCPSCSTKFSVADHIIRGKFVKFRCRKCQGTIECDGRALSASPPPPVRASRAPGGDASRNSEPPMRLSISDGLNLDGGSLAPPKVPEVAMPRDERRPSDPFGLRRTPGAGADLAPPARFTAPPTSLSQSDDLAKLSTVDTPAEGHTRSEYPAAERDGSSKGRRRLGLVLLVAAAAAGGWVLARQSAPPSASAVTIGSDTKRPAAVNDAPAATPAELARPTETAKAAAPASPSVPIKALDALAAPAKTPDSFAPTFARAAAPPKPVAKAEAPAVAPATSAPKAETPPKAEAPTPEPEPAGTAAEVASAMAAVKSDTEFDRAAARAALEEAGDRASSCRNVDAPAGAARVAVTFAPSGKVTSAVIESGPFVGTAAGGCVVSKFRNLHVPPFTSDEPVTVHKTLTF